MFQRDSSDRLTERYQSDLIWGPTLLVTGIGLIVAYAYEYLKTRFENAN